MTEADLGFLRAFLKERSGLLLGADKRYLVEARLEPVCRTEGFAAMADLVGALRRPGEGRLADLVTDAMMTNETLFFRDRAVFDALRTRILPGLIEARRDRKTLRVWCAAAATGQEPYSLAMTLADLDGGLAGWRVSVLATDISGSALARAKAGIYSRFEVQRGLPIRHLLRFFEQTGESWTVSERLRAGVEFRPLNLTRPFGHLGTFDLILCRNLLIYLDGPSRELLLSRLAERLAPGGTLCIGSTESALGHAALVQDPGTPGCYRPAAAPATSGSPSRREVAASAA